MALVRMFDRSMRIMKMRMRMNVRDPIVLMRMAMREQIVGATFEAE